MCMLYKSPIKQLKGSFLGSFRSLVFSLKWREFSSPSGIKSTWSYQMSLLEKTCVSFIGVPSWGLVKPFWSPHAFAKNSLTKPTLWGPIGRVRSGANLTRRIDIRGYNWILPVWTKDRISTHKPKPQTSTGLHCLISLNNYLLVCQEFIGASCRSSPSSKPGMKWFLLRIYL